MKKLLGLSALASSAFAIDYTAIQTAVDGELTSAGTAVESGITSGGIFAIGAAIGIAVITIILRLLKK